MHLKKNKKKNAESKGVNYYRTSRRTKKSRLGIPKLFINSQNKICAVLVGTSMPPFGTPSISQKYLYSRAWKKVFFYLKFGCIKKTKLFFV